MSSIVNYLLFVLVLLCTSGFLQEAVAQWYGGRRGGGWGGGWGGGRGYGYGGGRGYGYGGGRGRRYGW
ncbi:hypothetical protein I4U23_014770 [Adineta vaga]|nr:hypothetical protein I4U23_014770 [Adineta vaga]